MVLKELLLENRTSILNRWFHSLVETSPTEVSTLISDETRFSNPVGYIISKEINVLYDELIQERVDSEKLSSSLDNIIKIKAVQDCSPSQAINFVFRLKYAVLKELRGKVEISQVFTEWLNFESMIDELAFAAFDIYMKCREKIHELRVNELKAERENAFRLLKLTKDSQEAWLL